MSSISFARRSFLVRSSNQGERIKRCPVEIGGLRQSRRVALQAGGFCRTDQRRGDCRMDQHEFQRRRGQRPALRLCGGFHSVHACSDIHRCRTTIKMRPGDSPRRKNARVEAPPDHNPRPCRQAFWHYLGGRPGQQGIASGQQQSAHPSRSGRCSTRRLSFCSALALRC